MKLEKKKQKAASEQAEENGFARFDDLTRRLMAVPKKELDEKEAEYQAEKAKKKTSDKHG